MKSLRKALLTAIIGLFLSASLFGCGTSDPVSVSKTFVEAIAEGNFENAAALCDRKSHPHVGSEYLRMMLAGSTNAARAGGGLQRVEVAHGGTASGTDAKVVLTAYFKDGTTQNLTLRLKKMDGAWLIEDLQ